MQRTANMDTRIALFLRKTSVSAFLSPGSDPRTGDRIARKVCLEIGAQSSDFDKHWCHKRHLREEAGLGRHSTPHIRFLFLTINTARGTKQLLMPFEIKGSDQHPASCVLPPLFAVVWSHSWRCYLATCSREQPLPCYAFLCSVCLHQDVFPQKSQDTLLDYSLDLSPPSP